MQKHSSFNPTLRALTVLVVSLTIFFSYNFIRAAAINGWDPAPSNPPSNNTPAPINVSSKTQTKTGTINLQGAAGNLNASGTIIADGLINADSVFGTNGVVANNISLGTCVYGSTGACKWPYETMQLPFNNNLRLYFGDNERYIFQNTGEFTAHGVSKVNADLYCDQSGNNCVDTLGNSSGSCTMDYQYPVSCNGTPSCPAGYISIGSKDLGYSSDCGSESAGGPHRPTMQNTCQKLVCDNATLGSLKSGVQPGSSWVKVSNGVFRSTIIFPKAFANSPTFTYSFLTPLGSFCSEPTVAVSVTQAVITVTDPTSSQSNCNPTTAISWMAAN